MVDPSGKSQMEPIAERFHRKADKPDDSRAVAKPVPGDSEAASTQAMSEHFSSARGGKTARPSTQVYTQAPSFQQSRRFDDSARRLLGIVEQLSPKKRHATAPIRPHASARAPKSVGGGASKRVHKSASPPALTMRGARLGADLAPSQNEGSYPQTPDEQLGIRTQWELRTNQLDLLNASASGASGASVPTVPGPSASGASTSGPLASGSQPSGVTSSTAANIDAPKRPRRNTFTNASMETPPSPAMSARAAPRSASSQELPSSKNLVERMIAYSRSIGNTAPASNHTTTGSTHLPPYFQHHRNHSNSSESQYGSATSSGGYRPVSTPNVLAPSPILDDRVGGQFMMGRSNIGAHTDLTGNRRYPPAKPAPLRFNQMPRGPTLVRTRASYNNMNTRNLGEDASKPASITNTPRNRPSTSSFSTPDHPTHMTILRTAAYTPDIAAPPTSHQFTPYSPPEAEPRVPRFEPEAQQPSLSSPRSPNGDAVRKNHGKQQGESNSLQSHALASENGSKDLAHPPWKEIQWRQFSVAVRDSLEHQNISFNDIILLLSDILARLPPDMRGMSLEEVLRRLIVWVKSTENLKK